MLGSDAVPAFIVKPNPLIESGEKTCAFLEKARASKLSMFFFQCSFLARNTYDWRCAGGGFSGVYCLIPAGGVSAEGVMAILLMDVRSTHYLRTYKADAFSV